MARYDPAYRRRGLRAGRQRGFTVYIPAEEAERVGYGPDGPPPYYRLEPDEERRTILVRLYRDR